MNRFLLKGLASVLTMAVMFGTVSCSDDDDKPDGSVAVSAVAVSPTTATIKVGESTTLSATITQVTLRIKRLHGVLPMKR